MFDTTALEMITGVFGIGAVATMVAKMLLVRVFTLSTIAVVFVPLERLIPYRPKQRLFRPHWGLDFMHFLVGGVLIILFIRGTLLLMPYFMGWMDLYSSPLSLRGLPGWAQFLVYELGWTGLGYWLHRLMHSWAPLWRMHSIHESSQELDWLAAFRMHWLEPPLFHLLTIMPLFIIFQLDYPVAVAYTLYSYVHAHVQHANVVLPLGPLKYFFPSPDFHRWHHAADPVPGSQGTRNYGAYPFWDVLFGTLHVPTERPATYGNGKGVPMDYFAQQAYPFGLHEAVLNWERSFW